MENSYQNKEQDIKTAGVCGLYCIGCTAYIATKEDPERLKYIANSMGQSIDDMKCEGCRSNVLSAAYCRTCKMKKCAMERGVDFCVQCEKYPCEEIINFQKKHPID